MPVPETFADPSPTPEPEPRVLSDKLKETDLEVEIHVIMRSRSQEMHNQKYTMMLDGGMSQKFKNSARDSLRTWLNGVLLHLVAIYTDFHEWKLRSPVTPTPDDYKVANLRRVTMADLIHSTDAIEELPKPPPLDQETNPPNERDA